MKKLKLLSGLKILSKAEQRSINGGAGGACDGPLVCLPVSCICGPLGSNLAKKCCFPAICYPSSNQGGIGVCVGG